jgi:hypothetical protein
MRRRPPKPPEFSSQSAEIIEMGVINPNSVVTIPDSVVTIPDTVGTGTGGVSPTTTSPTSSTTAAQTGPQPLNTTGQIGTNVNVVA